MAEIQAPNGYEVNEAIDGANDIMEIFQPGSAGIRRNKKALLSVLKAFFSNLAAGAAGRIVTLTAGGVVQDSTVNISDVNDNTTHRSSDGSDHSKVTVNETAIGLNTTHRSSDGSDHSFIDQDVRAVAGPTFVDSVRLLTSANNIHAASISQNDVYDKISPFLPNIGDIMAISGGLKTSGALTITLAYATRLDADTIRFSGYGISSGGIASADADDGSATQFDDMSISW